VGILPTELCWILFVKPESWWFSFSHFMFICIRRGWFSKRKGGGKNKARYHSL